MDADSSRLRRLNRILAITSAIVAILIVVWIVQLQDALEVTFVVNEQQVTLSFDDPAVQQFRSAVGRGGIYSASAGAGDWEQAFAEAEKSQKRVAMLTPFAFATTFATALLILGLTSGFDDRARAGLMLFGFAAILFGSASHFENQPCGFNEYRLCREELQFLEQQIDIEQSDDAAAPPWVEETRGYLATTRLRLGISLALGLAALSAGGLLIMRGNFRHVIISGLASLIRPRRL